MAIKQLLQLIGDDIVIAKLDKVQKKGEQTLTAFNKSLPDLKVPIDSKPIEEFTGRATKLTDVLKVLKPALAEAGASVGGLGQFARVANIGLTGLAAAVTGAVVVKFAELEEAAASTKNKLSDLFGSTAAGEAAFNAINKAAGNLHTTVTGLLPAVESLARGLDKFNQTGRTFKFVAPPGGALPAGLQQDPEKQVQAVENLIKILRAGGQDIDQAKQAAAEFFAAVGSGGKLTAEILDKLPKGTIELLAEALNKGKISAAQFTAELEKLGGINIDKVNKGLTGFSAAADVAFNTKAVLGYKDALADLIKTAEDLLKGATGKGFSEFLSSELNKASADLTKFVTDMQTAIAFINTTVETIKRPFQSLLGGGGSATADQAQLVESFRQTGLASAEAFSRGLEGGAAQSEGFFQSLYQRAVSIFSTPIPISFNNAGGGNLPPVFASGGMVRGAGSATSDSILAFLSNREFVVNARAVSHYGSDLFAALNAMRLPRDFISRFSMGGLARSLGGNRFAAGGQVRSGNPVVLKIDRQSFNMTAGDDTIAQLKRFAVTAQLSSTGRKPRWVR